MSKRLNAHVVRHPYLSSLHRWAVVANKKSREREWNDFWWLVFKLYPCLAHQGTVTVRRVSQYSNELLFEIEGNK